MDVSESLRSEIWQHFLQKSSTEQAKCQHCSAILKITQGQTKSLRYHLKLHQLEELNSI